MFPLLSPLIHSIQPFLVPLCFVVAWGFLVSLLWTVVQGVRGAIARSKIMHRIPCSECQFFTNDYRLKCTLHPTIANTEQAIRCLDFTLGKGTINN